MAEVIAATGLLSGKTRRALDSTVLEDAVATEDTVTHEMAPAIKRSRRFGQLSELRVADNFGEPLPGPEIVAWHGM